MITNDLIAHLTNDLSDIIYLEIQSLIILEKLIKYCKSKKLKKMIKAQIITIASNLNELQSIEILKNNTTVKKDDTLDMIVNSPLNYAKLNHLTDLGIYTRLQRLNSYKASIYKAVVPLATVLKLATLSYLLQTITNNTYNINDRYERLLAAEYNKFTIINL